jgi:hypothetical protein
MGTNCNCGKTSLHYYNDENQYEPECWECYAKEHYDYSEYPDDPFEDTEEPVLTDTNVSDDDLPF